MTDGSALLMTMMYGWKAGGYWIDRRGVNMLDGVFHFYGDVSVFDGEWIGGRVHRAAVLFLAGRDGRTP